MKQTSGEKIGVALVRKIIETANKEGEGSKRGWVRKRARNRRREGAQSQGHQDEALDYGETTGCYAYERV